MESLMKTISDQHDEIHLLREKVWSQRVALDNQQVMLNNQNSLIGNQHALIDGLQTQISNIQREHRVQLEHLQKQISEIKSNSCDILYDTI